MAPVGEGGGIKENPRAFPQRLTGSEPPPLHSAAGAAAREGAGARSLPTAPGREALNLYRRPLAHTNPAAAAALRHDATRCAQPGPAHRWLSPGAGVWGRRGVRHLRGSAVDLSAGKELPRRGKLRHATFPRGLGLGGGGGV